MNHLYKTIFNKRTGQITVVSEKTSNNCQSQQEKAIQPQAAKETSLTIASPQFLKKQLTFSIGVLLSGLLSQISFAETITQTYTGTESLTNSSVLENGFKNLINNSDGNKKGFVVIDTNSNPITSDTVLTIDYNNDITPDFIISGYSTFNINDPYEYSPSAQTINIGNNQIILKKGNIHGSVYAGLIQNTQKIDDLNCTNISIQCNDDITYMRVANRTDNINLDNNKNKIDIGKNLLLKNDIDLKLGNNLLQFNLSNIKIPDNLGTSPDYYNSSYSNASSAVFASNNILTSNENMTNVEGKNSIDNINSGNNSFHFNLTKINSGNVTVITKAPSLYTKATSSVSLNVQTENNTLISNKNITKINGENLINNINVGNNNIELKFSDINSGNSVSESSATAYSYLDSTASVKNNNFTANDNIANIEGINSINNINVGNNNINLNFSDINSGNVEANDSSYYSYSLISNNIIISDNIFNSNKNIINIINGSSTSNINAGNNSIYLNLSNMHSGDVITTNAKFNNSSIETSTNLSKNKLFSNENIINIYNTTNKQNIISGQSGIVIKYYNFELGNTISINTDESTSNDIYALTYDFGDVELTTNSNKIKLAGTSTLSGDLKTGNIDFYIDNSTGVKSLLYINGNDPVLESTTGNLKAKAINLNGTRAFANNNTISIEGEHTFVQADIQDPAFPNDPTKTIKGDYGSIYGGYLNYNKDKEYFLADVDGNATDVKAFVRPESYDVFTGNTLNYNNSVPITIKEIGNFQNYNFTLNPTLTNQNLITANTVYLGSSLENMSANQLQKNIYNMVSQEALASASVSDDIKALLPTIADNATNPNYVITEEVKTALLASDISQQAKNLLADNAQMTSNIHVVGIQSGPAIATGTKFVLMQADKDNLKGDGQGYLDKVSQVQQGISLLYDVQTVVDHDNDQVYALFKTGIDPAENIPTPSIEPEVNPHLKALLEGNLSGLMLLTRGADHLSDNLFGDEQHKRGLVPFAIFSGQHSRYNTGSHIKSNSGLFTAGFSVYDDNTVWGAFIENGWDSYKTYNDFDNAPDVHGKGHNRFNGVGVFGRYTFDNQVYLDGTLRGGRLHTAFETDDIRHIVTGERASYNISGNYYGASLKGGYDWAWNTQNTVDLSAKYSWASTSSHDVNITGDEFHFDGLNSHRVLLNTENSYQFTPELSLISGLGYEYEFDGKAQGTTYGRFEIDDASVKGSTGVVTAGLHYEPSKYKRLSIDLKGSGYFGKREGGSSLLKVDYKF